MNLDQTVRRVVDVRLLYQVRKSDCVRYLVQLHIRQSDLRFSTVRVRPRVRVRDPAVGCVVAVT